MRMLRANILVKQLAKKKTSELVMPDVVKEDWYRGEVVLAGPEVSEIKVGDVVLYPPPFRGNFPTVVHDGQDMIILPDTDVWAIE